MDQARTRELACSCLLHLSPYSSHLLVAKINSLIGWGAAAHGACQANREWRGRGKETLFGGLGDENTRAAWAARQHPQCLEM
jgi:hypothetical protein